MTYVYQPYPRSLYRRKDGAMVYHGVPCEVVTVHSEAQEAEAKKQGWRNSPAEADAKPTYADLAAEVAKMDPDGDGHIGGKRRKGKRRDNRN